MAGNNRREPGSFCFRWYPQSCCSYLGRDGQPAMVVGTALGKVANFIQSLQSENIRVNSNEVGQGRIKTTEVSNSLSQCSYSDMPHLSRVSRLCLMSPRSCRGQTSSPPFLTNTPESLTQASVSTSGLRPLRLPALMILRAAKSASSLANWALRIGFLLE